MSDPPRSIGGDPRMDGGWRPDPTGRFDERFFDGRRWTERVRTGDAVAVDTGRQIDPDEGEGWHADPTGRFAQRFFDGRSWTKRVRIDDAVGVDTVGAPADCPPPAGRTAGPDGHERAAGWYPDPGGDEAWQHWDPPRDGADKQRYWNGHRWTAKTRIGDGHERTWLQQPFVRMALRRASVALAGLIVVIGLLIVVLV